MASASSSDSKLKLMRITEPTAGGEVSISFKIDASESGPGDKPDDIVVDVNVEEVLTSPTIEEPEDGTQDTVQVQEDPSQVCKEVEDAEYFIQKYKKCSRLENNDNLVRAQLRTPPGSSLFQGQCSSSRSHFSPVAESKSFACPNLGNAETPNSRPCACKFLSKYKRLSASHTLPTMKNGREDLETPHNNSPCSQTKHFPRDFQLSGIGGARCRSFSYPNKAHHFSLLNDKSCFNKCLGGSFENARRQSHSHAGKSSCSSRNDASGSQFPGVRTSLQFIPDTNISISRTSLPFVSSVLPKWRHDLADKTT